MFVISLLQNYIKILFFFGLCIHQQLVPASQEPKTDPATRYTRIVAFSQDLMDQTRATHLECKQQTTPLPNDHADHSSVFYQDAHALATYDHNTIAPLQTTIEQYRIQSNLSNQLDWVGLQRRHERELDSAHNTRNKRLLGNLIEPQTSNTEQYIDCMINDLNSIKDCDPRIRKAGLTIALAFCGKLLEAITEENPSIIDRQTENACSLYGTAEGKDRFAQEEKMAAKVGMTLTQYHQAKHSTLAPVSEQP